MTIFYPDLSHYDLARGVKVEPGTVALVAKATHGTQFLDSGYATFKAQAAAVGAVFAGYHWLNHGNGAGQAAYCYAQVGRVPVMVDAEDTSANTGYNGPLTVADIVDFVTALRAKGGICNLVYLPHWYWANTMGSPDLTPLARLGVGLVSSNYTTYSDSGPGWAAYGGMTPVCWQYSDNLPYGGAYSDFNAFRGSVDEFWALLMGDTMALGDIVPNTGGRDLGTCISDLWNFETQGKSGVDGAKLARQQQLDRIDAEAKAGAAPAVAPTQDQVTAAMLTALKDPAVLSALGAAVASHIHVS